MKRLALLLFAASIACAQNQVAPATGAISGASNLCYSNCVYLQLPLATPGLAVTVSGTWSGTLNVYEVADPNASVSNLNTEPWTLVGTITANGIYSYAGNGARFALVNASAFATGSATVVVATVAATTLNVITAGPAGTRTYPGINLFGDSITCGVGISNTCTQPGSYAYLLEQSFGGVGQNYGYSGDMALDMNEKAHADLNPSYTAQPATTMMIGTNDMANCQATNPTGCQANFQSLLTDSIVWAAVPNELKILFGTNPYTTHSGNWVQDSTNHSNWAFRCTGTPCVMTFTTLVPSSVMFISYAAWANGLSTPQPSAGLSCDGGVVTDTLNGYGYNGQTVASTNGGGYGSFTNTEVFPTNALHTCTVTVTASASTYGFTLVSATSPQNSVANTTTYPYTYPTISGPSVFVGGVIRESSTSPAYPDSASLPYNTLALSTCATLSSYGLPVYCVDTRSAVNNTTDMSATQVTLANNMTYCGSNNAPVHPGCLGHKHLADAFNAIARPIQNTTAYGRAVLASGTVTVLTTAAYSNSNIQLTNCLNGGTVGTPYVSSIVTGSGFIITSSSSSDTSTICWAIK